MVDVAAGHGLLAYTMLLLDDTSPGAICVDVRKPPSAGKLEAILVQRWPRLSGRVGYLEQPFSSLELGSDDLVVCAPGCGALTDEVLGRAADARARVAVLPCCHDLREADRGELDGWMNGEMAIDAVRALCLRARGYRIRTQQIAGSITPKNRLLLGEPL